MRCVFCLDLLQFVPIFARCLRRERNLKRTVISLGVAHIIIKTVFLPNVLYFFSEKLVNVLFLRSVLLTLKCVETQFEFYLNTGGIQSKLRVTREEGRKSNVIKLSSQSQHLDRGVSTVSLGQNNLFWKNLLSSESTTPGSLRLDTLKNWQTSG